MLSCYNFQFLLNFAMRRSRLIAMTRFKRRQWRSFSKRVEEAVMLLKPCGKSLLRTFYHEVKMLVCKGIFMKPSMAQDAQSASKKPVQTGFAKSCVARLLRTLYHILRKAISFCSLCLFFTKQNTNIPFVGLLYHKIRKKSNLCSVFLFQDA